jgi:spoIIIJ-associated protein
MIVAERGSQGPVEDRETRAEGAEPREGQEVAHEIPLEEQGDTGKTFLAGLLRAYGFESSVASRVVDEDTVEISAEGDDLGVLIGPRGTTLAALQEVTRTAVQRQFPARTDRILVDVAGYRQRRAEALQRFAEKVAEDVVSSGEERALEPMSAADRKVVHDSVNELEGVVTRSEGEDPSRYVVIARAV